MKTQNIFDSALRLSVDERFQLIEALEMSITPTQLEIDAAWADLAERRLAEYAAGRVQAISSEEVHAKILSRLESPSA